MAKVIRWEEARPPTAAALWERMVAEGLRPYSWSNGPGERYATHSHPFHKVLYVAEGSITFGLPTQGEQIELRPGDRLELPAGTVHNAVVGANGVTCLEAQT
ncbi:MAG: hypothetical protein KatS3mg057_1468 [Herpetosiphonaceae bacterium]|nr:MAG: hypothetical protein KatS3mg057_1468 [Herpetosiphonaceae bacterium]